MNINELKSLFGKNEFDSLLMDIYEDSSLIGYQNNRYIKALDKFESLFGEGEVEIYSAPGRTEVGGNHTDHQHGQVLAASINLDAISITQKTDDGIISLVSEGYDLITIDTANTELIEEEKGTTVALIKGVVNEFKNRGYKVGGFKAYITSDVLVGAGLSSSAAFEAVIGTILSGLYNDMKISSVEIAIISQYAENVYFGKPCGLMDQMACSVGGFVNIDFIDPAHPVVNKIDFDITNEGYSLCIVDTKGSHADLTDDYALIPAEMKEVAKVFGKEVLGDVNPDEFFSNIPKALAGASSRGVLRAYHFFTENKRVSVEVNALKENNFHKFLDTVKESGNSSYKFLQNIYANKEPLNQPVSIALAASEYILGDNGVCRVHGGGFAGTIQAFVKNEAVPEYKKFIESIFGTNSCHILKIRKYGGMKVQ